jgi:putative transposase
MKDLYSVAGISKQAIYKYRLRQEYISSVSKEVIEACNKIRKSHKRMSCRKMYSRVKNMVQVGRDNFEQIGFSNGFKLQMARNKRRTTWATKLAVFDNHLEGKIINRLNQALQSDIFYFEVAGKPYYGVCIIDVYSRRLLALHVSKTLRAEQNIIALRKAVKARIGMTFKGCIYHSDRGTQYISQLHIALLKELEMTPSMCKLPQENAYAERVQGTIKHEYLDPELITEGNIQNKVKRILWLYNNERPHSSLGNRTPVEYEQYISSLDKKDRPQMTVYKWSHPLLTEMPVANKKEKRSKKEKSQHQI